MTLRDWFPSDPRKVGTDPDYRFTLANERTFLAWIRTALALTAGGLGAITILGEYRGSTLIGVLLLAIAFVTAASSYQRWERTERAMRLGQPLPATKWPLMMAIGTAAVAVVAAVIFTIESL